MDPRADTVIDSDMNSRTKPFQVSGNYSFLDQSCSVSIFLLFCQVITTSNHNVLMYGYAALSSINGWNLHYGVWLG